MVMDNTAAPVDAQKKHPMISGGHGLVHMRLGEDGGEFGNAGAAIRPGAQRSSDLSNAGQPLVRDGLVQRIQADAEAGADGVA
jgi:hypothetical protein